MPEEDNNILKYNQGEKSMKVSFIIYADLESLLEKMNTYHNNPETSSTIKINKHTPYGYSLLHTVHLIQQKISLVIIEEQNCMKNVCLDLREHATKLINYEKKEMIPLTKQKKKTHRRQKKCHICNKIFSTDDNNKKYHKVKDNCHCTGK